MAPAKDSKKLERLNTDMKRELVSIINNMKDPRLQDGLLTITHVENVPDLSTCKVYISVLGSDNGATATVGALERAKGHIRSEIARSMHIRHAPEFTFIEDNSAEYADHINKLLKEME